MAFIQWFMPLDLFSLPCLILIERIFIIIYIVVGGFTKFVPNLEFVSKIVLITVHRYKKKQFYAVSGYHKKYLIPNDNLLEACSSIK